MDNSQFGKIKICSRYSILLILTEHFCSKLEGASVVSVKDVFLL